MLKITNVKFFKTYSKMKRITLLSVAIIALMLLGLSACKDKKAEQQIIQLQQQIDSLQLIVHDQGTEVSDFIASFIEIQKALNTIKEKENMVNIRAGEGGEISSNPDIRETIQQDIRDIYQLLLTNKQKVQELRNSLKSANSKFEDMIKGLEEQIDTRNKEIARLKEDIQRKNFQIEGLEDMIVAYTNTVTNLSSTIDEKQGQLNTAYFRVATKKTLEEEGILDKKGKFIPSPNSMYQKVDITTLNEVPVYAKKADMLSNHPANSYEWVGDKKQMEKLVIKDQEAFWSVQKYLVIQVKY
jgi:chromosome segregation ATPase